MTGTPANSADDSAASSRAGRAAAPRRGRPFRLPDDSSPLRSAVGGAEQRVAWLLAVSRLHHPDRTVAERRPFGEALAEFGIAADPARLSRWESGSKRVPDEVIAGYEQVLGLRDGLLTSVAASVSRTIGGETPVPGSVPTDASVLHEELDGLFEVILGDEKRDVAGEWVRLADLLTRGAMLYLRPEVWRQLTDRLVDELPRAVGVGYVRRYESLRMLLRHLPSRRHTLLSLGACVTDLDNHMVSQPLALFAELDDPQASDLLLKALAKPDHLLHRGAGWASARKLVKGHFSTEEIAGLEESLRQLALQPARGIPDLFALDVASQLPPEAAARVLEGSKRSPLHPHLEYAVHHGLLFAPATARTVARRMANDVERRTPAPFAMEPDHLLVRLLTEAMFHAHQERRHQSGLLLAASPYREAVAHACVAVVDAEPEPIAQRALSLLLYVSGEPQREALLRWGTDDLRPELKMRALLVAGHLPGGLSEDEERLLLAHMRACDDTSITRATLYALGMHGATCLHDLARDERGSVRRAAARWLERGGALHDEAAVG